MKHERKSAGPPARGEPLSRRAFFRLNAALIAAASTASCTWRGQHVDTRNGLQLLRAEDLLSLHVVFCNLVITHRYLKPARLVREVAGQPARITFTLSAQHVAEAPFTDDDPPPTLPVASFGAQPSTLSFEWPATLDYIDLTTDQLLNWGAWRYLAEQSTIAVPAGITLTPDSQASWQHARRPVTFRGRSELWHTRLTPGPNQSGDPRVFIALADPASCDRPAAQQQPAFERLPSVADRCAVNAKEASIRTLMLTPMGAWLDLYGAWDSGSVARWEHRASAGQDQRVLVEGQQGFLFPFGHRASVITVTEREPADALALSGESRRAALLRQRRFIVIKQPDKEYAPGATAFRRLSIRQKVTSALSGAGPRTAEEPFWVESGGAPFTFQFDATDWAGHAAEFSANVVFVPGDDDNDSQKALARKAKELHDTGGDRRLSALAGQSVVVAPYQLTTELDATRTEGDTLLHLLALEHGGDVGDDRDAQFNWRTAGMQARIPALTNNLTPEQNLGWFDYLSPDDSGNAGEVFAVARKASGLIAMTFSDRADRSGGVAAPSIDVEGISRLFGPVGDVESVRQTGTFAPASYFSSDALLLGGFGLNKLGNEKSPLVPQLYFEIKQKEVRDKKWYEESDAERKAPKRFETTVEGGLKWAFPLPVFDIELGLIALRAHRDDKVSLSKLKIRTALSKTFGPPKKTDGATTAPNTGSTGSGTATDTGVLGDSDVEAPEERDEQTNTGNDRASDTSSGNDQTAAKKTPLVDWSATAELTKFDLELDALLLGTLTLSFKSISATLGSPKPASKKAEVAPGEPATPDTSDTPAEGDTKPDKPALQKKIKFELDGIAGTGALVMVGPLLLLAKELSESVKTEVSYGYASPPAPYPASVPSVDDADLSVNVGPIAMPDIKIGTFGVSDISVSVGVGFYVFPRKVKVDGNDEYLVPANRMTAGFGTPEKPLAVVQEPWGGIAHMAFSFDFGRGVSGFQFGMGISFGSMFDFKLGKAKCLGSLSVIYTYVNTVDMPKDNSVTLMLRIDGKAHIAGWIDVTLKISASGTVGTQGWVFELTVKLQVKIAFFTVGVSLELRHVVANEQPEKLKSVATADAMDQAQWEQYQLAFAGRAAA